jgi:HlyD family secretion protein
VTSLRLAPAGQAVEPLPLAVLEFQSPTAAVIATPIPRIAGLSNYFITGFMLVMLVIGGTMHIDRIVSARGELVSAAPNFSIQAFSAASIVQSIDVHPGELVTKGQLLADLNPTDATADLTSLTQQEQGYAAEVARLRAQENNMPYNGDPANPASVLQVQTYNQQQSEYEATMAGYDQKIAALQTTIEGLKAQAQAYDERLTIANNVLDMRQKLQNLQVGSKLDTEVAKDDRVNIQSEMATALNTAASDEKQVADQRAERASFDGQWRAQISAQLSTALNNLAQAEQALAKARLADQLVQLRAPQDAIVQSVSPVSVGSVMAAGQTIMELAPVDAPLTVSADISAAESGYVHVGDQVNIKFDTLPFLRFGAAKGTVTSISPESFNPLDQQANSQNGAPLPGGPQTLYYKAQVAIDVVDLHDVPPGFRLVPGMPLVADMKVGKRTVLGYFTQSILPTAYNSLHEP